MRVNQKTVNVTIHSRDLVIFVAAQMVSKETLTYLVVVKMLMNAWDPRPIALMGQYVITFLVVIIVHARKDLKEMGKMMDQDAVPNLAPIQGKRSSY